MAGQLVFTEGGRDAISQFLGNYAYKFMLGEGGFAKSELVTEIIDAGATGLVKSYTYTVTGGEFDIIGADSGSSTFTVEGNQVQYLVAGAQIKVQGSTANDGTYTVISATLSGSDTDVVVDEEFLSDVADGILYVDRLPICKGPTVDVFHHVSAVVEYNGVVVVQKLEDTTGTGNLTQTAGGTTGVGTLNYKTGALSVTFQNNVGAGHTVVFEYKYANVPLVPVESRSRLYSQDDSSLFTFEKNFQSSDITQRGVGYGTARIAINLSASEGIDDGDSYGGIPYYFEGGIFDESGCLLVYFTFDKEKKTGSSTISHTIDMIV